MKNSIFITQEQAELLKGLLSKNCEDCCYDEDFLCPQCPVTDLERQLNKIINEEKTTREVMEFFDKHPKLKTWSEKCSNDVLKQNKRS